MVKYTIKRLLYSVIILFFVMFIIYILMYNMPSGYVETKARELASRPGATKSYAEWLAALNAQYGMDQGVVRGYLVWLGNAVRGNWGDSWAWTIPVTQEFHNTVWYSFILGLVSFVFEIIIAIPLGITAARKQYSFTDYFTTVISMICISMPTFFVATVLKYVFSVKLGWFDLSGMQGRNYQNLSDFGKFLDVARHFVLPSLTIVITDGKGQGRAGEEGHQLSCIPEYPDSSGHDPGRIPSQPFRGRPDYGDPVLHTRDRIRFLYLHDHRRYSLHHVLSGFYFHPDAPRQSDFRPSLRDRRSPCKAQLRRTAWQNII